MRRTGDEPYRGKKLGPLEVVLDRKKDRYTNARVTVELRLDLSRGMFYAQWEGRWYQSTTKDDICEQIKAAATKSLSIEWKRYIQIDYEAEGHPIMDSRSSRPWRYGRLRHYRLDDNRAEGIGGKEDPEPYVISGINLKWSVSDISEPYVLPEDSKKRIRAQRTVEIYEEDGEIKEHLGDPQEWEDDVLPDGTFLWTAEREAFLGDVLKALRHLDGKLVALFMGDAAQLGAKIDAAGAAGTFLLPASPENPSPRKAPKKRRSP